MTRSGAVEMDPVLGPGGALVLALFALKDSARLLIAARILSSLSLAALLVGALGLAALVGPGGRFVLSPASWELVSVGFPQIC